MRVVPDKRWQERLQEGKRERDETAEDGKDNEPEA
jgi:hypothetical protein